MKISQINAFPNDGTTRIDLTIDSDLSVTDAISSVLALFAGSSRSFTSEDNAAREAVQAVRNIADGPVAEAPAKATRARKPRTNPDAAPAAEEPTAPVADAAPADAAPVTERRRTRVTQEAAQDTVKTITDADLAKACSNAAAIIGIEVVQAVIADFHVKYTQELAADVRERFLGELEDEIELAKAELATAGK